jgi:4'-phosphopantetheinyl transferase
MTPAIFDPLHEFAQFSLPPAEIHLRLVDLDDARWDGFFGSLSIDEEVRAARYRSAALAQSYRRGRAALRQVLACYAGPPPRSLALEYGQFGKPSLRGHALHFNLSHSGSRALIGVSRAPLGVDLEWTGQPGLVIDELLPLVCNAAEEDVLLAMPERQRRAAFFQLWTQKEAYCKALGVGLQRTLGEITFEALADRAASRVFDKGEAVLFAYPLSCIPDHSASLCSPDQDAAIRWY